MRGGGVGLHRLGLAEAERLVDQGPARHVLPVHEGHRHALVAGAARAAHAVHVGLLVLRRLEVEHVGDVVDVDAARRDVGGHEDVHLAVAERAQRLLAGALAEVAVQRAGREAARRQLVRHASGRALGAREDDGPAAALGLQGAGHELVLVHVVGAVDELTDVLLRQALVLRVRRADVGRLRHVAARHRDHGTRHGGREQHGLTHGRDGGEQGLDVGEEAEVQHLVGLVQHHGVHQVQAQVALAHQVDEAAGGADDDLDAALQLLDLRLVGAAAVDGGDAQGAPGRGGREVAGHLDGELARRGDDQGLRGARGALGLEAVPAGLARADGALQRGDAEAEGLAGAGLGLADDVVAAEGDRQGHGLDGEGVDDALGLQGLDDRGVHPEVGEGLLGGHGGGVLGDDVLRDRGDRRVEVGGGGGVLGVLGHGDSRSWSGVVTAGGRPGSAVRAVQAEADREASTRSGRRAAPRGTGRARRTRRAVPDPAGHGAVPGVRGAGGGSG